METLCGTCSKVRSISFPSEIRWWLDFDRICQCFLEKKATAISGLILTTPTLTRGLSMKVQGQSLVLVGDFAILPVNSKQLVVMDTRQSWWKLESTFWPKLNVFKSWAHWMTSLICTKMSTKSPTFGIDQKSKLLTIRLKLCHSKELNCVLLQKWNLQFRFTRRPKMASLFLILITLTEGNILSLGALLLA